MQWGCTSRCWRVLDQDTLDYDSILEFRYLELGDNQRPHQSLETKENELDMQEIAES